MSASTSVSNSNESGTPPEALNARGLMKLPSTPSHRVIQYVTANVYVGCEFLGVHGALPHARVSVSLMFDSPPPPDSMNPFGSGSRGIGSPCSSTSGLGGLYSPLISSSVGLAAPTSMTIVFTRRTQNNPLTSRRSHPAAAGGAGRV